MTASLDATADPPPAAAVAPAGHDEPPTPARLRGILATTILASSLAFVDGSIVNVGLAAVGRDLGTRGGDLSWVVNGYLLPLSALLLLGGAAGDRYGRRRLLLLGVALFGIASLLCAAAPTLGWLVAGRVAQGVGAALLLPNSLAVLGTAFDGEARGRAVGTWAAVGAGAGALGPLVGGALIDAFGWRAMFLVNLPLAAAAFALGWRCLPGQRDAPRPPLDLVGGALATAGLAAVTWGLTDGSGPAGFGRRAATAVAVGGLLLLVFVAVERRRGERAMLPLTLFASKPFVALSALTFLLYGALGGVLVLLPWVLIDAGGYSATAAGAALLPLPLVIGLTAPTAGRLAARFGARWPLAIGPLVAAAGFVFVGRVDPAGGVDGYWLGTLPALLAIAVGMAGVVAPLTTAVLAAVAPGQTGVASGFNSALARSGGLFATALAASVLALHGPALVAAFQVAAWVGGGAALAAGACAFVGLRGVTRDAPSPPAKASPD